MSAARSLGDAPWLRSGAAGRVLALLNGPGDYLVLHNLACIYAELSRTDRGQAEQHQDAAMALIGRAVEVWRRGGTGPNEIALIAVYATRGRPHHRVGGLASVDIKGVDGLV